MRGVWYWLAESRASVDGYNSICHHIPSGSSGGNLRSENTRRRRTSFLLTPVKYCTNVIVVRVLSISALAGGNEWKCATFEQCVRNAQWQTSRVTKYFCEAFCIHLKLHCTSLPQEAVMLMLDLKVLMHLLLLLTGTDEARRCVLLLPFVTLPTKTDVHCTFGSAEGAQRS